MLKLFALLSFKAGYFAGANTNLNFTKINLRERKKRFEDFWNVIIVSISDLEDLNKYTLLLADMELDDVLTLYSLTFLEKDHIRKILEKAVE